MKFTACFCALVVAAGGFIAPARAQFERGESIGKITVYAIDSLKIPQELEVIKAKIGIGWGGTWTARKGELTAMAQDVVVAESIVFEPNSRVQIAPKAPSDRNEVYFIANKIEVQGTTSITWDRSLLAVREPIRMGKAPPGAPSDREGVPGRPGANGAPGNRGSIGRDGPAVIFVANQFVAKPILFDLRGQDGAAGGLGQDGGDGGRGAPGRAEQTALSPDTTFRGQRPDATLCNSPVDGSDGGQGGDGGPGGEGGKGGAGGFIVLVGPNVDIGVTGNFVDGNAQLEGGRGGPRGAQGLGGTGGPKGAGAPAVPNCRPAAPGRDGVSGKGRDPRHPPNPDASDRAEAGASGSIGFSKLTSSQAKAIGLP